MAPRDNVMYNSSYFTSLYVHNDLISDFYLFHNPWAIFEAGALNSIKVLYLV